MEDRFIEVNRVISNQMGENDSTKKQTYHVSEISSVREWRKGSRDKIESEMLIVTLKRDKDIKSSTVVNGQVYENSREAKDRTILVAESYSSFMDRLSFKAPVSRSNETR